MGSAKFVVLDVAKEPKFQELRQSLLKQAGYTVICCGSANEAEIALQSRRVDALIVGALVPKAERTATVQALKQRNSNARIIFYYDQNIDDTELADAILNLRGDVADLSRTLRHLLAKSKANAMQQRISALLFWVSALPFSIAVASL
jgi:DNA-binding NtrC family response regulator